MPKLPITKENIDFYLKELAKEFRKRSGKSVPAEIILIGGASVLINYGFREVTYDMDAMISASSAMKDAINVVGDKYGLPVGWLNDDFIKTTSYSPRIISVSKYYRTYFNIVTFRTVTGAYLAEMKMMSSRQYKYDRSDVIGILWEHEKAGEPLTLEMIKKAVSELYGSYGVLADDVKEFIEHVMNEGNYEEIYTRVRRAEAENRENLIEYQNEKPGAIQPDNVNDIIAALRRRKSSL